jgi:hypothetical protein
MILEVILRQTVPGAEECQADVRLEHSTKKSVYWWVILKMEDDELAMKRVIVPKMRTVRLEFMLLAGEYQLELEVECDSYMGLVYLIDLGKVSVRSDYI